ncbi:MAG: hypothetical protein ABEL51_12620, partial [Salinibacter sp.]
MDQKYYSSVVAMSYIKSALRKLYEPNSKYMKVKNRLMHYNGPDPLQIIVTGQPRSGTSFLAGLLSRMGLSAGPIEWLKSADEHNPYGYFECLPLLHLSEEILADLGGGVNDVPRLPEDWTSQLHQEKRRIQEIVTSGGIELYKDNRLMILADLYDEIFPSA